jgi:hypothetical protein
LTLFPYTTLFRSRSLKYKRLLTPSTKHAYRILTIPVYGNGSSTFKGFSKLWRVETATNACHSLMAGGDVRPLRFFLSGKGTL